MCHLRGASRGMWQHVDTPSDKLKKDSSLAPVRIARRRSIKEERVQRTSINSPAVVSSRPLPTILPHRLSRKQAKADRINIVREEYQHSDWKKLFPSAVGFS